MRFVATHPLAFLITWASSLGLSLTQVELYLQIMGLVIGILVAILTAISKWYEIMEAHDEKEIRDAEAALDETEHAKS